MKRGRRPEARAFPSPMLAVPVPGQFEQIANARYLDKLGDGRYAPNLSDPKLVFDFVAGLDAHERKLAGYHQDGNREILQFLDARLAALS